MYRIDCLREDKKDVVERNTSFWLDGNRLMVFSDPDSGVRESTIHIQ